MQFDTFTNALIAVFSVLTCTFVDVMQSTILSYGWGSVVYYIEIIVLGNFLLLNLFLAILLKNVEE